MRSSVAVLSLIAMAVPVTVQAQTADPKAPVQALSDGLIGIMKSHGSQSTRMAAIGPVIDRSFDIPLMTRLAVGPAWNGMTPADQAGLVAAFRRLTVSQYAANFDSWSGQSFTVSPDVTARGADRLVRTQLNDPKDSPVAIAYRLRQSGGAWKIIDVYYKNSVSQLAIRRSDFAGVLNKGGAKALIAHLNMLADKGIGF